MGVSGVGTGNGKAPRLSPFRHRGGVSSLRVPGRPPIVDARSRIRLPALHLRVSRLAGPRIDLLLCILRHPVHHVALQRAVRGGCRCRRRTRGPRSGRENGARRPLGRDESATTTDGRLVTLSQRRGSFRFPLPSASLPSFLLLPSATHSLSLLLPSASANSPVHEVSDRISFNSNALAIC